MRRVVVTGLGVFCSLGRNLTEFWESLHSGTSAIAPIEKVDRSKLDFPLGCEVRNYDELQYFGKVQADQMDQVSQFAVLAAREAWTASALSPSKDLKQRTAVIVGCISGGTSTNDESYARVYRDGKQKVSPMMPVRIMHSAPPSLISIEFGITGPTFTVDAACASGAYAIAQGTLMIRSGCADAAICGGTDAPFGLVMLKGYSAMGIVSPDSCRPFSRDRRGTVFGEGAAMFVLENLETAERRGATILGEICGLAMSSDANSLSDPDVASITHTMKIALNDAALSPSDIGYINAHGTGTRRNDAAETAAIKNTFGEHAYRVPISSTKSMHGHTLGAAGALEAAAALLALRNGVAPPTANYREFDPECDLDVVPNVAREIDARYALSNSFGLGGLNATLVLGMPAGDT